MRVPVYKAKTLKGEWVHGIPYEEPFRHGAVWFLENPETGESVRIDQETLCEGSDLFCDNGRIYEGDVIIKKETGTEFIVEFRNGMFGYENYDTFYGLGSHSAFDFARGGYDNNFLIIRNIHD